MRVCARAGCGCLDSPRATSSQPRRPSKTLLGAGGEGREKWELPLSPWRSREFGLGSKQILNLSLGPFREDPGRSSGGSRLGGSPAAGALGSDLRNKGLEEAEEFSWEVCFSSVGISGPCAPELAEGSDLQQSEMMLPLGAGFPETLFPTTSCLFLSECWDSARLGLVPQREGPLEFGDFQTSSVISPIIKGGLCTYL